MTLSLLNALLGVAVLCGWIAPDAVTPGQVEAASAAIWNAANDLLGLLLVIWGLQGSAKRLRESEVTR